MYKISNMQKNTIANFVHYFKMKTSSLDFKRYITI